MDIRCPSCNKVLIRDFAGPPGAQAEGFCGKAKCHVEVFVRVRRVDNRVKTVV